MAGELALTATQIGAVYPDKAEIVDIIAGVAITAGQGVYIDANGRLGHADANFAGKEQFRGIALRGAAANQVVPVLKRGHCYGFTLSGAAYDAALYVSDAFGQIATVAGTMTIHVGRVVPLPDAARTKVVFVQADWLRTWT